MRLKATPKKKSLSELYLHDAFHGHNVVKRERRRFRSVVRAMNQLAKAGNAVSASFDKVSRNLQKLLPPVVVGPGDSLSEAMVSIDPAPGSDIKPFAGTIDEFDDMVTGLSLEKFRKDLASLDTPPQPDKDHVSVMVGERRVEINRDVFGDIDVLIDGNMIITQRCQTGEIAIKHNDQWHKIADSDEEFGDTDNLEDNFILSKNGITWEITEVGTLFIGHELLFRITDKEIIMIDAIHFIKQHAEPQQQVLATPTADKNGWMGIESVPRNGDCYILIHGPFLYINQIVYWDSYLSGFVAIGTNSIVDERLIRGWQPLPKPPEGL